MKVYLGSGETEYGPGVQIDLTSEEVARAIYTYLAAHDINIFGAATISVNGEMIQNGGIYIDPSAYVISGGIKYSGKGTINE